jgi:dihydrofolate reductase
VGTSAVPQCLDEELVDEILIHLVPVLLGDGTRLFEAPARGRINLEKISVTQSGSVTNLRFRVVKQVIA